LVLLKKKFNWGQKDSKLTYSIPQRSTNRKIQFEKDKQWETITEINTSNENAIIHGTVSKNYDKSHFKVEI
jgi:hypothetical protein